MKKLKEELKYGKKGITLISLVVTIIVLLILAGVTIATLTGDNGILNQATRAKEETQKASEDELRKLTMLEATTNLENTIYTDKNNETITIPAGFAVSQIEGENTIADGLVIIDSNGNEFVWVPCTENEYKGPDDNWAQFSYTDKIWTDEQSTTIGLTSIRKYGGFYIARYEAGIPENATEIFRNSDGAIYDETTRKKRNTLEIVEKYIPVSKKNMPVWNYVDQTNAKILAEKIVNNEYVKSYLIDSYAWNAVCRLINQKTDKDINNSTSWGNYYDNVTTNYEEINTLYAIHQCNSDWTYATEYKKGKVEGAPRGQGENRIELATGSSENFKVLNIYDLAGNMYEWTTEKSGNKCVIRGGSLNFSGNGVTPIVKLHGGNDFNYYCRLCQVKCVIFFKI